MYFDFRMVYFVQTYDKKFPLLQRSNLIRPSESRLLSRSLLTKLILGSQSLFPCLVIYLQIVPIY